jgi:protein-export membrane protein SecD
LAGIKDVNEAIKMIGETPSLDFREAKGEDQTNKILAAQKAGDQAALAEDPYFGPPTELTGKYIAKSQVEFDANTGKPEISLEFNGDGAALFEKITERNVGKRLAIYLDGAPISAPVVQEAISGGQARISGNFTIEEAKTLVQRLNAGALPVPIKLINQQTIGASLGETSLAQSLRAGLIGLLAVALFMIGWYRWPGIISVVALLIYTLIVLAIFKLIPVTLTLAGIAGFILSIGMAVDANILIFERTKEELKTGKSLTGAVEEGFKRAWTSIRDSNISSLITCAILFWLGTSIIKGFALTLALGILVSMFSAITVTRTFLLWFVGGRLEKREWMWK